MRECDLCGNTGWRSIDRGGASYAVPCDHGADGTAPGAGFRSIAEILRTRAGAEAALSKPDIMIAKMIETRSGKTNAITIQEIAVAIWPAEWERSERDREHIARSIKDSVARLREFARLPIAASKQKPYGYFMPATAEEADEYAERIFGEGIKLIRICSLFRPDRDWVQELRGQLTLPAREER